MRRILVSLLFGLCVLGSSHIAAASPITYNYTAVVSTTGGLPGVAAGNTVTGAFTYESSVSDSDATSTEGFYSGAALAFSATVAGITMTAANGNVEVQNDVFVGLPYVDSFGLGFSSATAPAGFTVTSATLFLSTFNISNPFSTPLTSDALSDPAIVNLVLSNWLTENTVRIRFSGGAEFSANLTSLTPASAPPTSPVPEPASFMLLGIGLAGLALRYRRSKTNNGPDTRS